MIGDSVFFGQLTSVAVAKHQYHYQSIFLFGDRIHVVVGRFGCPSSAISIEASLRSPHNAMHSPSYIGGALHPSPNYWGCPSTSSPHLPTPMIWPLGKMNNFCLIIAISLRSKPVQLWPYTDHTYDANHELCGHTKGLIPNRANHMLL